MNLRRHLDDPRINIVEGKTAFAAVAIPAPNIKFTPAPIPTPNTIGTTRFIINLVKFLYSHNNSKFLHPDNGSFGFLITTESTKSITEHKANTQPKIPPVNNGLLSDFNIRPAAKGD
ncbi:hypothetical protein [Wolbachia endosymbiont (group A) of Conops quadrifasciatus]|uniref:hypothetical protein n=1 Tax=Wolbachia endosymbiont (group A) of Conops quadrifasciatus TaxID=3066143 RepID=UPI0031332F15